MKYVIILPDGAADYKIDKLEGKTPLQAAEIPNIDYIAAMGETGSVKNIPEDLPKGSDVAIMSVLGYDPVKYYMGRGPLEAINMGIDFSENDIIFRCNTVTIENGIMSSSNAGHIKTEDSEKVISYFNENNRMNGIKVFPGVGYRHILLLDNDKYPEVVSANLKCIPPHDIVNQTVDSFLPSGQGHEILSGFIENSHEVLKNCGLIKDKEFPANTLWPWGHGKPKKLDSFADKYNVKGAVISAVDLVNGIAKHSGLDVINVPGATGYYDSNFKGKADYAIDAIDKYDFIFVHLEATDEAGHDGNAEKKVEMLELIDSVIIGPVLDKLKEFDDFKIMVLPDHPTPVIERTHTGGPVPYAIFHKNGTEKSGLKFSEEFVEQDLPFFEKGYKLIEHFINEV